MIDMNRIIRIFVVASVLMLSTFSISKAFSDEWREKIRSEKVGFLTTELSLTTDEAQRFWPLYNEASKAREESFRKVKTTYKALEEAINANKSDAVIESLLNKYLQALHDNANINDEYAVKFKKVLPVEKVAKLYVSEEKFRRQQFHKLKNQHGKPENGR